MLAEWAFVNSASDSSRGEQVLLSAEMAASQGGYSLVSVDPRYGVLIAPDGSITAVQQVDAGANTIAASSGSEAPTKELHDALVAAKLARVSSRAPCPVDANVITCRVWCQAVVLPSVNDIEGMIVGSPCIAQRDAASKVAAANCSCHRTGQTALLASCRSPCHLAGGVSDTLSSRAPSTAGPTKRRQARTIPRKGDAPTSPDSSPAPGPTSPRDGLARDGSSNSRAAAGASGDSSSVSSGSGAASRTFKETGGAAVSTTTETTSSAKTTSSVRPGARPARDTSVGATRYLLYDTRFGTSFGTQTEVLFVAMRVVAMFNSKVADACGSQTSSPRCAPWTLVLPPWCAVVHWYSDTSPMSWKELFEVEALRKEVPVIEFDEYVRRTGRRGSSASVDLAAIFAVSPTGHKGNRGDFDNWQAPNACQAGGQTLPQWSKSRDGALSVVFSGYCDGDVRVKEFRCGILKRMSRNAVEGVLSDLPKDTGSVLLKHLDAVPLPTGSSKVKHLHSMLHPAKELTRAGDIFITDTLGDLPYLAAHLRRNDLVHSNPEFTPGPEEVAARLNFLLKELNLEQVFVATDARPSFCETLRRRVKAPLYYFARDDGAILPDHKGKEAVTVLRILAQATHFVGTPLSSFTAWVHRERKRLGKASASQEVFCKGLSIAAAGQRCQVARD